jgi:hypothetical protein
MFAQLYRTLHIGTCIVRAKMSCHMPAASVEESDDLQKKIIGRVPQGQFCSTFDVWEICPRKFKQEIFFVRGKTK